MIDIPLYDSSNFIGTNPFFSTRKCTQILFWINVNHLKILLEAGDFRSIRNLGKATEKHVKGIYGIFPLMHRNDF